MLHYLPLFFAGLYLCWQLLNYFHWRQSCITPLPYSAKPEALPSVSLLIPARNEARNLPQLLSDLQQLHYPQQQLSICVIDDYSTDKTAAIAYTFPGVQLLHLADFLPAEDSVVAHKKAALSYAIQQSEAAVIVTTDADCRWSPHGLSALLADYQSGSFLSGPVLISSAQDLCSGFQALDFMAYMFLTAAYAQRRRPILANGANLAIDRQLFHQMGGYQGVDHLPSGDDVLLLHKLQQNGQGQAIRFINRPEAVVYTQAVAGWRAFWQQRLRWAGKSGAYRNQDLQLAQGLSYLTSLSIVLGLVLSPIWPQLLWPAMLTWLTKAIIDGWILWSVSKYYRLFSLYFRWYFPAALIYPFYLTAIGTAALLGFKAKWKGR
ncbi:MAG: glycosyltransferase [Bacteroidota bacterium]